MSPLSPHSFFNVPPTHTHSPHIVCCRLTHPLLPAKERPLLSPPPSACRECASEAAALVGLRTSPLGCYLLLLLKGAPAELWTVSGEGLDLFFGAMP